MATMMPTVPSDMLQMLSRMERFLTGVGPASEDEGTLALDIYEEADAIYVEASVPGFERDDIAIQLHQGLLSIVASRPAQPDGVTQSRRYYRRERPVGAWTRRIALPGVVHDAEVDAELKGGVLTLRIPIPESAKPRRIEIRSDSSVWEGSVEATTESAPAGAWNADKGHATTEPVGAAQN
jgi:HSP20 family protein